MTTHIALPVCVPVLDLGLQYGAVLGLEDALPLFREFCERRVDAASAGPVVWVHAPARRPAAPHCSRIKHPTQKTSREEDGGVRTLTRAREVVVERMTAGALAQVSLPVAVDQRRGLVQHCELDESVLPQQVWINQKVREASTHLSWRCGQGYAYKYNSRARGSSAESPPGTRLLPRRR